MAEPDVIVKAVQPGIVDEIHDGEYGEQMVRVIDDLGDTQDYVTDTPLVKLGQRLYKNSPLGTVKARRIR